MTAIHGGDGAREAHRLGLPPDAILDASANVSPDPQPTVVADVLARFAADATLLRRYPDTTYATLRGRAARYYGIDDERIACANGSAALLPAALHALSARMVLLPVPSFSEYRAALAREAAEASEVPLAAADGFLPNTAALVARARAVSADTCIIANPNNPTGAVLSRERLFNLVERLAAVGTTTIVDEAFVEYVPEAVLPYAALPPRTIVLRSITKFHALAGVRVGFAIADASVARRMHAAVPSWSIGAIDAAIAEAVLSTPIDRGARIAANARRRARLTERLRGIGVIVFPGSANFLFCDLRPRFAGTAAAFRAALLARERVLVRACDDYRGLGDGCFVRIAILDDVANERVVDAIARLLAAHKHEAHPTVRSSTLP
jgi:threonine-phosphate decarboxylase